MGLYEGRRGQRSNKSIAALVLLDVANIAVGGYYGLMHGLDIPTSDDALEHLAITSPAIANVFKHTILDADANFNPSRSATDGEIMTATVVCLGIGGDLAGVGYTLGYGAGKLVDLIV